jgi:polyhydroxybutyrate depolymerase
MRSLLVLTLGLVSCAPEHEVLGRPYSVQVPKGADAQTPLPLVVLLHGYGVNGVGQDILFPFSSVRDQEGFLYALPDGTADQKGKRFWNATDACCADGQSAVDDVAFLTELIADVARLHPVDPRQVYVVGHSNGAFMALRMACDRPELITGVVSIAGSTWNDFTKCPSGRPVAVLQVHGTKDTFVPYEGRPGEYPGARETTARFAARNGCAATSTPGEPLNVVGDDAAETTRDVADGCPPGGAVERWTIDGAGHLPSFRSGFYGRVIDWLKGHTR